MGRLPGPRTPGPRRAKLTPGLLPNEHRSFIFWTSEGDLIGRGAWMKPLSPCACPDNADVRSPPNIRRADTSVFCGVFPHSGSHESQRTQDVVRKPRPATARVRSLPQIRQNGHGDSRSRCWYGSKKESLHYPRPRFIIKAWAGFAFRMMCWNTSGRPALWAAKPAPRSTRKRS